LDFQYKEKYDIADMLNIMKILRSPDGCPWDKEQTHKSIRSCFIEETYEAVEAIDNDDPVLLKEELGDVLLQVLFHSQLESEQNSFDFSNVVDGIAKKMIVRHPHVFGDTIVTDSDEVLVNWDIIKKETKSQTTQTEVLQSVSKALPALMRSAKVQKKASKVGLDWPDVSGALHKVNEEFEELKQAIASGSQQDCDEELGDLLFSVVNVSRFLGNDPEFALSRSCDKFISRFEKMEQLAEQRKVPLTSLTPAQLDLLWNEVKTN